MANYSRPGVYIEEIPSLPPSVVPIETAIPVFIGYTSVPATSELHLVLRKIFSMREYEDTFGKAQLEPTPAIKVEIDLTAEGAILLENVTATIAEDSRSPHIMNYALQAYFLNGGGPCWIISSGPYSTVELGNDTSGLQGGLIEAEFVDEITILVFPEAVHLGPADKKTLYDLALAQCFKKKNRFLIADVLTPIGNDLSQRAEEFRNDHIGFNNLKYAAAYAPMVQTVIDPYFEETQGENYSSNVQVEVTLNGAQIENAQIYGSHIENGGPVGFEDRFPLEAIRTNLVRITHGEGENQKEYLFGTSAFNLIKSKILNLPLTLPPSPLMAGIYVQVDQTRGVFKAPANVSLTGVIAPNLRISDKEHDGLNVHASGKSINAIRSYPGRGILVFGARTLDGNSNDWRYISVRRFFNFAEVSIANTLKQFVFEPNDKNTWERVRGMIANFLTQQWQQGALTGNSPDQAFFVNLGLGSTMTAVDILEGRMIIEVGMAVVRPAEFIILKFSHMMQNS